MKVMKRSFQKMNIVSESIIQSGGFVSQTLINLDNGKKLSLLDDCKLILIDNESFVKNRKYIKLMGSKYQLCTLKDDFSGLKITQTNYFCQRNYIQGCIDFKKYNGLILLLQFNQLLLLRRQKIILKINQQGLRILNQKILKNLPLLFQPSEKINISWSLIFNPIIEKFKQYFKIHKDPPEYKNQIKAHNNVFVLQRSPNDQFLYLAEFSYFQNNKGMIRKIIIYENDFFLDLSIINGVLVILIYRDYCFRLYKIYDEFILENNILYTHPDKDFANAQIHKKWLIICEKEIKKVEINV